MNRASRNFVRDKILLRSRDRNDERMCVTVRELTVVMIIHGAM